MQREEGEDAHVQDALSVASPGAGGLDAGDVSRIVWENLPFRNFDLCEECSSFAVTNGFCSFHWDCRWRELKARQDEELRLNPPAILVVPLSRTQGKQGSWKEQKLEQRMSALAERKKNKGRVSNTHKSASSFDEIQKIKTLDNW